MSESWLKRQTASEESRLQYEQERLAFWATEIVSEAMEQKGVSKAELARLLGTSRANVTSLLGGQRNLTLRTFADLAFVLGERVCLSLEPLRQGEFVSAPARVVQTRKVTVSTVEERTGAVLANTVSADNQTALAEESLAA